MSSQRIEGLEASRPTAQQWRWTALAAMADYVDAGSIVAGAAGLALWQAYFHMSTAAIGLLAAFSSNAISAAVGALLGADLRCVRPQADLLLGPARVRSTTGSAGAGCSRWARRCRWWA